MRLPAVDPQRPICTMFHSIRTARAARTLTVAFTAVLLLAGGAAPAQTGSGLPPMPPTSSRGGVMAQTTAAAPSREAAIQRHRARVSYADGLLEVRADNSSLNQILREIARQTGMTIVGGVADQRVFGVYGPAPAATVLKTLLDGTGTNMLLQETASKAPKQLTLTPQTGAAIYPGPSSPSFDATESEPELSGREARAGSLPGANANPAGAVGAAPARQVPEPGTALGPPAPASVPPSMPAPMNNAMGSPNNVSPTASTLPTANSVPTDSLPTPSTAQPASGIVDAPNPPPQGSTTAGFTGSTTDNNPNNPPVNNAQPAPNPQSGTTNSQSPNGVKTPQQIYDELRQMEQQKQQQPSAPTGTQAPQQTPPQQP